MKIFLYEGARYVRILPRPKMYNSQMVRSATNRGAIFAMNVDTCEFTILDGKVKAVATEMVLRRAPNKKVLRSKQLILTGLES